MIKFSIIVPTYNSEKTIRNCLNSILAQTFDDFEIIVINDGSTDNTLAILKEYQENTTKLHLYSFDNAGVSISRRRGIDRANGEYIVWVDSDDTINPELLENLDIAIKKFNTPDIIRFQANLLNDRDFKDHNRYNFFDPSKMILSGIQAIKEWSLSNKKYAVYWIYAFRRTVFSAISSFPEIRCYEDVALIPILLANSEIVVTLNYIGYNYTCNNPGSITNQKNMQSEKARAEDFVKAYNYVIQNFKHINAVTLSDYSIFVEDFTHRLRNMFYSLPNELQKQLFDTFWN